MFIEWFALIIRYHYGINVHSKRWDTESSQVHHYETQPEAASKKCMKWWDVPRRRWEAVFGVAKELQKCQWYQAKPLGLENARFEVKFASHSHHL